VFVLTKAYAPSYSPLPIGVLFRQGEILSGHRRSVRLKDYDYASEGMYWVTLCIQGRRTILGSVDDEAMHLSDLGQIVEAEWKRIPLAFPHAELDEFQVMPNHLHGIIMFDRRPELVGANNPRHDVASEGQTHIAGYSPSSVQPTGTVSGSLAAVIQNFKKNTGRVINRIQRSPGKPVWQRNYYEHIIRSEEELERLREYIVLNPSRWAFDQENR
jgi:putative transposase